MIEIKNPQMFFIPSYCVSLVMACAQSHPYEGYEPATTKEVAAAQEETQINSMDRISKKDVRQAHTASQAPTGKNTKGSAGSGSSGTGNNAGGENVDPAGATVVRSPSSTGSQGIIGTPAPGGSAPSSPSVGAGSSSGGAAPPPAGP